MEILVPYSWRDLRDKEIEVVIQHFLKKVTNEQIEKIDSLELIVDLNVPTKENR